MRQCPVARTSQIRVQLPVDAMYSIQPDPHSAEWDEAKYDLKQGSPSFLAVTPLC